MEEKLFISDEALEKYGYAYFKGMEADDYKAIASNEFIELEEGLLLSRDDMYNLYLSANEDDERFNDINDINDAIVFKGDEVYVKREDLDIDGYVDEDIIGLKVYDEDKLIGKVTNIIKNKQELLVIKNRNKNYLVPFVDEFIKNIDLDKKILSINVIEGLLDEN